MNTSIRIYATIIILLEVLILCKMNNTNNEVNLGYHNPEDCMIINEKKDIGYHKPTDCMVINEEDIFCKISVAVDYWEEI